MFSWKTGKNFPKSSNTLQICSIGLFKWEEKQFVEIFGKIQLTAVQTQYVQILLQTDVIDKSTPGWPTRTRQLYVWP